MVCAEKIRLRDEHSATARCLRAVLKNLGTKTGYELVKGLAALNAARAECAKARRPPMNTKPSGDAELVLS
jgi:hypothetical protein